MFRSNMKNSIQIVVDQIGATYNDSEAVNVFYVSAYFAEHISICNHMFLGLFPDTEEVHKVVRLLCKFELVDYTYSSMFFIQPCIQNQARNLLKEQNKEIIVLTVAIGLVNYFLMCNPTCAACLNHTMSILKHASCSPELVNSTIGLPGRVAMRLVTENQLNDAISFCDSILSILNDSVGESHRATLDLLFDLSALLVLKDNHPEAVSLLEFLNQKHLEYSEKDETALILTTAAKELYNSSQYDEALRLYQAILGARKVSEITSTIVLTALKNYAFLLKDLGRPAEAMQVLEEVIQHGRKTSKINSDEIFKMKKAIAHIHMEQREFSQALEHFHVIFHEVKAELGENHPDTQRAKKDIGIALQCKGNYYEASKIFESVVDTLSQIYDESHTDIINAQINLAGVLEELDYDTAIKINEDLYRKYRTNYGEMHKETLQKRFNIGCILRKQGQLHEAKYIFQEILEGFLTVFGLTDFLTTKVKMELKGLRFSLPMHTATKYSEVLNDDESAIINFIESGASVEEEDSEGRTLLHHAARMGYITAVEKLLEKGAMYNYEELSGKTPVQLTTNNEVIRLFGFIENLFHEVKNGNCEKIAYFFSIQNEIVNVKDEDGYSLLHWAVYKCSTPIVKLLLKNGADVRSVSSSGNTVLHIASSVGNKEIIDILLQDVDKDEIKELVDYKTTILGNTALHFAAANGYLDIVTSLLKHGASFNIANKKGKTPAHISNVQSVCTLLNKIQELFLGISEGNPDAIPLLRSLGQEEFNAAIHACDNHNCTLQEVGRNAKCVKRIKRIINKMVKNYRPLQ